MPSTDNKVKNWSDHRISAYANHSWDKIVKNSTMIFEGDLIALNGSFIRKALASDVIEGVARQTDNFSATNETVENRTLCYRPINELDTYSCYTINGTFADTDVGKYFNIDGNTDQNIDYTTKSIIGGQARLEKVLSPTCGEFTIILNRGNNMGPQGLQGNQGSQGNQGIQGSQGNQGAQGNKGDIPDHERSGESLRFENPDGSRGTYTNLKGAQGNQGLQGNPGIQGLQGIQGVSRTWRGTYNGGTTYPINHLVEYFGSTYISIGTVIGQIPGTGSLRQLVALKGTTGLQGLQGEPGQAGGPAGPQGNTGPAGSTGPQGNPGIQGPQGDKGDTGQQGQPGPLINERATLWMNTTLAVITGPISSSEAIVVWNPSGVVGNNTMIPAGTVDHMKAVTSGLHKVSVNFKTEIRVTGPDGFVRTSGRLFVYKTDSSGAIDYNYFGFIDEKDSKCEPVTIDNIGGDNNGRESCLSGSAQVPMMAGDKIYVMYRVSNEGSSHSATGKVLPAGAIPTNPNIGIKGGSSFTLERVYNVI